MARTWTLLVAAGCLACGPEGVDDGAEGADEAGANDSSGTEGSGTGDGSSDGTSATDETDTGCAEQELATCADAALADYEACAEQCAEPPSCAELECLPACEAKYAQELVECDIDHCGSMENEFTACSESCTASSARCFGSRGCHPHSCLLARARCGWHCGSCSPAVLDFEYTDSCTLALVPGFDLNSFDFSVLEIGGLVYSITVDGDLPCDEPGVGGSVSSPNFDELELCPEPCASFMELGSLVMSVQIPCGP